LKPVRVDAERGEFRRWSRQVETVEQSVMNRRAEVAGDAALKHAQEACFGFDPASRGACDPYIIIARP
jgi:hypothetical protein